MNGGWHETKVYRASRTTPSGGKGGQNISFGYLKVQYGDRAFVGRSFINTNDGGHQNISTGDTGHYGPGNLYSYGVTGTPINVPFRQIRTSAQELVIVACCVRSIEAGQARYSTATKSYERIHPIKPEKGHSTNHVYPLIPATITISS